MSIDELLMSLRGERIVYVPNPGNAGDSVIAAATYQAFDRLGIDYELVRVARIEPAGRVVVYGGGGNLVGPDTFAAKALRRLHRQARRFVLLPHTVRGVDELLGEIGANVDIVCRERVSYDYVRGSGTRAHVHLADDMALGLDLPALAAARRFAPGAQVLRYGTRKLGGRRPTPMWANLMRATRQAAIVHECRKIAAGPDLNCLRLDGERSDAALAADNIDLSEVFQFGVEDPELARFCAVTLADFLSGYRSVTTNRLHVAITGALCGIEVRFHSNNYYKCKAVYEHSMRERFANVRWMSG